MEENQNEIDDILNFLNEKLDKLLQEKEIAEKIIESRNVSIHKIRKAILGYKEIPSYPVAPRN